MYQVGITGGIGSGKSLVCGVLEKLGVQVYYADREARRLMNDDPVLVKGIRDLLGAGAYRAGKLDRVYVAEKIFSNRELMSRMNKEVHPFVRKDYTHWVESRKEAPYVVEEAAILFESGAAYFLDWTVLVFAPEDIRIKRVMLRDGVQEESVRKRMVHQIDEEKKKEMADEVIINDEQRLILPQIIEMHRNILNRI
jgi:dephospho-CoA kinase